MPLDGKQLDELLSGFIDGELTDEERDQVEKAARADVRVAQQIEALRRQSSWVCQVGQQQLTQAALREPTKEHNRTQKHARPTFADAVIAEAQRRGRELQLPATHHVRLGAGETVQLRAATDALVDGGSSQRASQSHPRRSRAWLAAAGVATAAVVLLAITWPVLRQPSPAFSPPASSSASLSATASSNQLAQLDDQSAVPADSQFAAERQADTAQASQAAGSSLVGVSDGLAYALVVDVEITSQAAKSRVLEKLLTAAGIPLVPPVAANTEILKALDDSRLVVRDSTSGVHAVSIQVVRGGLHELDGALRKVWQDRDSFPNVGLNLSIDSRAALMREMLRSSGDRFASTDRFAVPLSFGQVPTATEGDLPAGRASPLMAADVGVQYVSSAERESSWESLGELPGTTSEALATILLVIHYAD